MTRERQAPHEIVEHPFEDIDLFDYLQVIYRYRWLIVLVCLLAALVTGVVSFLLPPRYVATTSVVPPLELMGGDAGLGLGLLGGAEGALLRKVMDSASVADMYVGVLESRAVTDAIIDQFDLIAIYDVEGLRYKATRKLRRNTHTRISEDGIVHLTVEDADPNRAAAMANAYIEQLDVQNKRLSAGQATSKRVFLAERLGEVEQKLQGIENMPAHEAQVQGMLYELLVRELELARIEEAKSMPTLQVLDPAVPPEVRKAKGTVSRAVLAGVTALLCTIFLAFGREYLVACRVREQGRRCADRDADRGAENAAEQMETQRRTEATSRPQIPVS